MRGIDRQCVSRAHVAAKDVNSLTLLFTVKFHNNNLKSNVIYYDRDFSPIEVHYNCCVTQVPMCIILFQVSHLLDPTPL